MQPTPPDERIDAPPRGLEWSERIHANGGGATFSGPPPTTRYGLAFILVVAFMGFIASGVRTARHPGKDLAELMPLGLFAAFLAYKWRTSAVSAAVVDVDASRVRIEPVGTLVCLREIPLGNVDYFAAETEIEMRDAGGWESRRRWVESYRWYPVFLHLASGERIVIAAFAERECALFIAQRLDMLAERAKVVAGAPRPQRAIEPRPYR